MSVKRNTDKTNLSFKESFMLQSLEKNRLKVKHSVKYLIYTILEPISFRYKRIRRPNRFYHQIRWYRNRGQNGLKFYKIKDDNNIVVYMKFKGNFYWLHCGCDS